MVKLLAATSANRRRNVEDAAQRLFIRLGFNAVGLRDIAKEAKISIGNIYNYFPGKEPIFAAVIQRLYANFCAPSEPLPHFMTTCELPDDIIEFGQVMSQMVERHRDYLTLVYVDIAEFSGKHARPHYSDLAARFASALPKSASVNMPTWADPGLVFTVIYLQFANYFIVERLIGAKRHLGLNDKEAIQAMAKIFMLGLAPRSNTPARQTIKKSSAIQARSVGSALSKKKRSTIASEKT